MYGFTAYTFKGKNTAGKALDAVVETSSSYRWIDDVAVLSRSNDGSIRVNSTWAQDDDSVGAGAGLGMLTGGMIGLLLGPAGSLAGAAMGGTMGALFADADNYDFGDPKLETFATSLVNNSSALVLIGEETSLPGFVSTFTPYGGDLVETNLDENDVKAIKKALKQY